MPIRALQTELGHLHERRKPGTHRALGIVLVGEGTPNAAITASPANFSTVPPCVTMQRETWSKKLLTRRRTTSGSASATSAVESDEVTNSTVASLRSMPQW